MHAQGTDMPDLLEEHNHIYVIDKLTALDVTLQRIVLAMFSVAHSRKTSYWLGDKQPLALRLHQHNFIPYKHALISRSCVIVAGERRSASRSQWAEGKSPIVSSVLERPDWTDAAQLVSIASTQHSQ